MKSLAAILVESRQPLQVLEIDVDENLLSGQVLVEMEMAGLCGSQIGEIDAIKGEDKHLPHLLGHEGIGRVLKIASDVSRVRVGDRVVAHWMKGFGKSANSGNYLSDKLGKVNSGQIAIFSEVSVVSEDRLTVVAKDFDAEIGAIVGCALLTSYGVLQNELEIEKVHPAKVLIAGFGGIGESLSLLARKISSPDIYVLDKRPTAVAKAREVGLNVISVEEISNHQFDFIVDTTGMPRLIELAYESLSSSGVLSLVGVSPKGEKISIDPMPLHYGRRIIGSFGGSVDVDRDLPRLINLLSEHTSYFKNLVGEQFRLVDINKAISLFRKGSNQGRILLSFG